MHFDVTWLNDGLISSERNVDLMLRQRHRPASAQRLVFAIVWIQPATKDPSKHETSSQCWLNSGPPSATSAQY